MTDARHDYRPTDILTARELAEYLRMPLPTLMGRLHRRAWASPLEELPAPFVAAHNGRQAHRWRFSEVQAWIERRAEGYREGVL